MSLLKLRTGIITSTDGSENPPRSDKQGGLVVAQSHGKYTEAAIRKQLCYSYCAARATSVLTTAMIGNIVWNPPGSGVLLALGPWSIQIEVTSATCTGIVLGYSAQTAAPTTTTAPDSYGSTFLNAGSSGNCVAKAYAIGTVAVAPTPVMHLFHNTAAIATTGVDKVSGDFDGLFIVSPGYLVCFGALGAAVAASGMTSTLMWEEIPE